MTRIKVRSALALTVLTVTALVAAGPANATPRTATAATMNSAATQTATTSVAIVKGGSYGGVFETTTVAELDAGATGDGPADQDECDRHAAAINEAIGELREAYATDSDTTEPLRDVQALEDGAMDRGCFLIY